MWVYTKLDREVAWLKTSKVLSPTEAVWVKCSFSALAPESTFEKLLEYTAGPALWVFQNTKHNILSMAITHDCPFKKKIQYIKDIHGLNMLNREQVESRLIFHRYVSLIKFCSVYLLLWTTALAYFKFMETQ